MQCPKAFNVNSSKRYPTPSCRSSRNAKESIVVQVEQLHELSTKSHMVGPETSGIQATNISSNVIYHDIQ